MFLGITLPIVAFLHLFLGILVIIKNPKARDNRFFALVGFLGAIWTSANYITGIRPSPFWLESTYALGALVTATVLLWILAYTDDEIRLSRMLVIASSALLFFGLSFQPGFIAKTYEKIYIGGAFVGTPGFGLLIYTVFYVTAALVILTKLFFAQRKTDDVNKKLQFRLIFYAVLAALSISALTSFIFPLFSIFSFGGLDSIGLLFFLTFVAFAILRRNLFNLKVIATELLIFAVWIFLFVRIVLGDNLRDRLIDGGLLALVIFFGIFLIRSVLKEVRQREEISRLAEDLRKANLELKKLDQLKSDFVSLASHQLRTPLTVIKGYISLIQEGSFGQISDQLKDALRKIYISNETLINLVGDFLNLSRIESGKMKYSFEAMSVEEMLQGVYEEFGEIVKEKKLELYYEKPPKPLPQAMLDKDKFRQVIMNLVDNAVKYTKTGAIRIKVSGEESSILISVADTGVGMTSMDLNSIFKRFSRGEDSSRVNTGGLGLGLYLAKKIVSDHGGEIWATSEGSGKGSTFWVRVPARAEQVRKDKQFEEFVTKI